MLSSKSTSKAANSYFLIHIALHDCLLFVASVSARNCSPRLTCTKLDEGTQLNCSVVCIFGFMWHCRIVYFLWPQLRREIMLQCTKLDSDTQLNFSAVCIFVPYCSGRDGDTPEGGMLVYGCSAVAFRAFRQDDSLS